MCPAPQLSPTFPPCPDPQRFSTFPPGPAPQLSPACSLIFLSSHLLSPGVYSFVHYSPAFFTERLKQKSLHTAANSMISTAFFCAFRFPSRGQVYRQGGAQLSPFFAFFRFFFCFLFFLSLLSYFYWFLDRFWEPKWVKNQSKINAKFDQFFDWFLDRFFD